MQPFEKRRQINFFIKKRKFVNFFVDIQSENRYDVFIQQFLSENFFKGAYQEMPEINIHEYLKRKLDFEAKLTDSDMAQAWINFHTVMKILKNSKMDKQRITAFSLLSASFKEKKVPGFACLGLARQRYLVEVSLQTADYYQAQKRKTASQTPKITGRWAMVKTR